MAKRDPFLDGPLKQNDLADEQVRSRYVIETESVAKDESESLQSEDCSVDEFDPIVRLKPASLSDLLFDYQADLVEKIVELCSTKPPRNIGLVALPTGAGKTRTATVATLQLLADERVQSVLWLAPSRELLDQAVETFRKLWNAVGGLSFGVDLFRCHVLRAYPSAVNASVYFSTPQMLYQRQLRSRSSLPLWDLVIFDEAHLAEAPTYCDALALARDQTGRNAPCFGLSATPGRANENDTESLVGLFSRRLLTSRILGKDAFHTLQERGVLAEVEFKAVPGVDEARKSRKDLIKDVGRFRATTTLCRQLSAGTSTLVFTGSVRHAIALALSLRFQGVAADWITGAMKVRDRAKALKSFEVGATSVLTNKSLLATGYDCPAISNVVLTVPIGSPILFEQIVGRASRGPLVGGNARSTVWHFDDHLKLHGRPSSYQRYSLSGWR